MEKLESEQEIEIFGKRDILNEITEISTVEIDMAKIDKSDTYEVKLDFPDGVVANNETIDVMIELTESKVFNDVPIDKKGENADNVTFVNPADAIVNITANGSDELIRSLQKDEITTSIDVGALDVGEHKVELTVDGPKNVKLEPEFKTVTVRIEE